MSAEEFGELARSVLCQETSLEEHVENLKALFELASEPPVEHWVQDPEFNVEGGTF